MTKFVLIIWVCSFLSGAANCFPPVEFPKLYDSWYECSIDAHTQSKRMLASMGFKVVNDAEMGTKYTCRKVYTY
jgi:hypothetical protein